MIFSLQPTPYFKFTIEKVYGFSFYLSRNCLKQNNLVSMVRDPYSILSLLFLFDLQRYRKYNEIEIIVEGGEMPNKLRAGSAATNITPPLGTAMPGGFRPRYAEDIDDELLVKSLVVDNGSVRLAMVTCDLIVVTQEIVDQAKERIEERCGIAARYVMINATHTHTAVAVADLLGVNKDKSYIDWVYLKIADVVELAIRRLQPARIGFASVDEDRIAFYRRWRMKDGTVKMNPGIKHQDLVEPVGDIDPEIAMMYVESENGISISAVANFSLHYIGTDSGSAISADYFGHFSRLLKRYLGETCISLLWNAASGQINNIDFSGRSQWTDQGHRQAEKMANVLAGHLITEMQFMQMHETVELNGVIDILEFPRKEISSADLELAEKILSVPVGSYDDYEVGPFNWVVGQPIPTGLVDVYALECQRLAKLPRNLTAPVQLLRLGEAVIVALPGEIFVEIGLNIKSSSKGEPTFLVSLANGYIGYVCTDEALIDQGGYETWAALSSLGGVGTAQAIDDLVSSLFPKVMSSPN